jgi:glyoxylase-like metal-dependent hydrolase (beta-lactamase superfamily II)/rhodanese-related sulfurtransferase
MDVCVITTTELGDRSYLVHDGHSAVVIDPQRDIDRVLTIADELAVRVALVVETHIHNDYVTGGLALARRTSARYGVAAADEVAFDRLPLNDGDELTAGSLRVTALATPGHTPSHLAYRIEDAATPDAPPAVFTGGSLLYGSVGRTDLADAARTDEFTRAQFRSARRLADLLPDETVVYPTHGFGSFCSAGAATGGDLSTIGQERARNDALTTDDEDAFVTTLVANLTAYPAYYAHMGVLNRQGPGEPDLSAATPVDSAELTRRLAAGEWVVDLRSRTAYAADHLEGTVSVELGSQFSTYVGWLAPWGGPLTLLAEQPRQLAEARLQLSRIGVDELAATAAGSLDEIGAGIGRQRYERVDFAECARRLDAEDVVLDVRRADEFAAGHVADAVHVPLADLVLRLDELPPGRLWVHCASGFRASIAASLLQRAGREVVHIDDDYENAADAGFALAA